MWVVVPTISILQHLLRKVHLSLHQILESNPIVTKKKYLWQRKNKVEKEKAFKVEFLESHSRKLGRFLLSSFQNNTKLLNNFKIIPAYGFHLFSLSSLYRLFLGSPFILIHDPEILKEVMVRNFSHFYNRMVSHNNKLPSCMYTRIDKYSANLFSLGDEIKQLF